MEKESFVHRLERWMKKYHLPLMPFIWGITCLVIGLLVGIGLHEYYSAEGAVVKQFNSQQLMLAKQAARGIESYLSDIRETSALLTRDPDVRRQREDVPGQTMEMLYRSYQGKISFLFLYDSAGGLRAIYPAGPSREMIPKNFHFKPFLEQARTKGRPVIRMTSRPKEDGTQHFEVVWVVAPIFQGSQFLGALGCGVDMAKINDQLVNPIHSGVTGGAWMINQEGHFIAHYTPEFIGKDAFAVRRERDRDLSTDRIDRIMREEMLRGKTGMDEYFSGGHREKKGFMRKLIAYAPIQVDEQIWSIAVVCPYSDVTQVVWESFKNSAWLLAVTAGILLLGTFVGHKLNQGRIRAEEKVRWGEEIVRSESRLQAIFDGAPDAIAIVARDYRISMLNKTGLAWYKRPLEAFRGKLCHEEFQGRQALCPNCPAEETFRTGRPAFRQKASLIAGGNKHYLQIFTFPLRNLAGEIVEVVEYVKDVTAERELQQKIIQNERLAVVGRMAANVAHEIKNPLGTIVLNAELLEDELARLGEVDSRESRSLLGGIKSEIDRLLEVIEEYLQFARLPKAQIEEGNLNDVLATLLSFLKEETANRKIMVVQNLEPTLPPIPIDAKQLRQAFLNIIKNSFDAMPEGGKLTVSTARKDGQVEILIADTGRGIPEKSVDLVFTPFFSTKHGGTGLGLPITAHIIQEHRGDIHFESFVDLGTIFRISLPVNSLPSDFSDPEESVEGSVKVSEGEKGGSAEPQEHLIGG